jgi:hypothetical protein
MALRKGYSPMGSPAALLGFPTPTRKPDPRNLFGRGIWGPDMKAPVNGLTSQHPSRLRGS